MLRLQRFDSSWRNKKRGRYVKTWMSLVGDVFYVLPWYITTIKNTTIWENMCSFFQTSNKQIRESNFKSHRELDDFHQ